MGGMVVTPNYFHVLGLRPMLGREFTDAELSRPKVPPSAIILAVRLLESASEVKGTAEWNLANAYYYAGQEAKAELMLRQKYKSARSERRAQATLASFLAAKGETTATAEARELIRVVTGAPNQDHHVAYALGAAYAQLNMPTEALDWLQKAKTSGFPNYPWYARDRLLAPLRQNASFERFLLDFKQSWETTKAQYETER